MAKDGEGVESFDSRVGSGLNRSMYTHTRGGSLRSPCAALDSRTVCMEEAEVSAVGIG